MFGEYLQEPGRRRRVPVCGEGDIRDSEPLRFHDHHSRAFSHADLSVRLIWIEPQRANLDNFYTIDSCGTGGGSPNWFQPGGAVTTPHILIQPACASRFVPQFRRLSLAFRIDGKLMPHSQQHHSGRSSAQRRARAASITMRGGADWRSRAMLDARIPALCRANPAAGRSTG